MRILTLNISDQQGGASRAAMRLHRALLKIGVDSRVLVDLKSTDDPLVVGKTSMVSKYAFKFRHHIDAFPLRAYSHRDSTPFSPARFGDAGLVDQIREAEADILHMHWIGGGMLRFEDLLKIDIPIVWSMHDQWAFTGGCHLTQGCLAFTERCGSCFVLKSDKEQDLSRKVFLRKQKVIDGLQRLTMVGLSEWMVDEARSSGLMSNTEVVHLPNPIDTDLYDRGDQSAARRSWSLPQGKKVVVFGAMNAEKDRNKGMHHLIDALKTMIREDVVLAVFGADDLPSEIPEHIEARCLGSIDSDDTLISLYRAADLVVVPSLQENLSNVIMESLSCGTPVVGFDIGGNADMIDHQVNGYLASAFDPHDLANGIEFIIDHREVEQLRNASRQKILRDFTEEKVARRYEALYRRILDTHTS